MNSNYKGMRAGFATVTTLFFMWGFITVSIDPLIAALKAIFELTYAEAMLTQFAFFMAYFVVSLPAAALIARLGNSKSIMLRARRHGRRLPHHPGWRRTSTLSNWCSSALFVIASGITILQVVANPLAAALGPARTLALPPDVLAGLQFAGHVARAVPGVGIVLLAAASSPPRRDARRHAEQRARVVREDRSRVPHDRRRAGAARRVHLRVPPPSRCRQAGRRGHSVLRSLTALKSQWALFGGVAIFLYVGAEVSIGSAMTNFLHEPDMLGVPLEDGRQAWSSFYWGGAMVGRFIGSVLLFA